MNTTHVQGDLFRLPMQARTYRMVQAIGVALLVTAVACAIVVAFRLPVPVAAVVGVAAAVLGLDLSLIPLRHAWYRYRVTDREFHVSRGRFVLRTITVAVPRILHAEVSQGPLLRVFGLADVRIKMVLGDHDLGPVTAGEAEHIRQVILLGSGRDVDN